MRDLIFRRCGRPKREDLDLPPSIFYAPIHRFKRSPIMLRSGNSRKATKSCGSADIIVHEVPQSPSGSSDEASDIETPSKPRARTRQAGIDRCGTLKRHERRKRAMSATDNTAQEPACQGLYEGVSLDDAWPNVNAHRPTGTGNQHRSSRNPLRNLCYVNSLKTSIMGESHPESKAPMVHCSVYGIV